MTVQLPQGWTVDEETEDDKLQSTLPKGWVVDEPRDRELERNPLLGLLTPEERASYEPDVGEEQERQFDIGKREATKGAASGLTFGLTKNVPGLKPGETPEEQSYFQGGDIAGSFVPLSGLIKVFSGPAMKLATKSPILQKQLGSLATMFGAGATNQALQSITQGEMPTAEDLIGHGVEWAALDAALQFAGSTGRFVKALLTRSKATGQSRTNLINRVNNELAESGIDMSNAEAVSAKALEILEAPLSEVEQVAARRLELAKPGEQTQEIAQPKEITPKDLKTRKISDEPVNRLTKEEYVLAEPYAPESANFNVEAESLEKSAIDSKIDSVGIRAGTEEELGNAIREDIESQLEARKSEYRPLYEAAESEAEGLIHSPENTGREAGKKLMRMSKLKTKPEGYAGVLTKLENILEDTGFKILRDAEGNIENIISSGKVHVSDTIELARRLNEIIDYEAIEPSVKDALRSVVRAAKQDIRAGLAQSKDALAAFELAEQAHAQTAKRFSRESVRKIRGQQAGERIAKMVEAPTTLGDLREVLSPQQMMQLEREMLEKLNAQNYEKAQKMLKQTERHLSGENKKLAREIVESKNSHNPTAKKKITQDGILNDMSNAFNTGTRPDKTLNLWKTPKGQKLVKETFHNSPNWPTVKEYLEKQSFNDMVSSVLKDGKIDLKKYKSFMRDPSVINNIRAQGGEEAVQFFRNFDTQIKQLESNIKMLDKLPKVSEMEKITKGTDRGNKILQRMVKKDFPHQARVNTWKEWLKDSLGLNAQAAMTVFGMAKLTGATMSAVTLGVPNTVLTMVGYKLFNKMLTSPRVRRAFMEASKHQTNPVKFILALESLDEAMKEEG